ncbi:MAG: type III-B CRISPR module RAMP protein Cmr1 [Anaerolineae bacterium]
MPKVEFTLQTVSPMFLSGADTQNVDESLLRAPSVIGQLRYWYRAFVGATVQATRDKTITEQVYEKEANSFGKTEKGSLVTVRMWPDTIVEISNNVPVLPHHDYEQYRQLSDNPRNPRRAAISVGMRIKLKFSTRPGVSFPEDYLKAMSTWLLLGGLGKRSRRCFGALQIADVQADFIPNKCDWWRTPMTKWTAGDYRDVLRDHFDWVFPDYEKLPPPHSYFPCLHPQTTKILLSAKRYESGIRAGAEAFRLIRSNQYPANSQQKYRSYKNAANSIFGRVDSNREPKRQASPLHVQVRKLSDGYHLIFTALGNTLDMNGQRGVMKQFAEDVCNARDEESRRIYAGVSVWGEL